jgi:hypothetical protein
MTYWILKENGYVIARSTVRPLTQEEERSDFEKDIRLEHGDRYEIAQVLGCERQADGLFVWCKHQNPILDSRVFVVEFPDGD